MAIRESHILKDAVKVAEIAANSVGTEELIDGGVTTPKIADAPNGATTAKINDGAVTDVKIADGAVTKAEIKDLLAGTVSIDPPSIAATTTTDVAVTVSGLTTSHKVIVCCQEALEHGLVAIAAWASAADQLTVRITNWTGAAIDGVARSWFYLAYIP